MQTLQHPIDYENAIAGLVRQLPTERAVQLYDFARFLLQESEAKDQFVAIEAEWAEGQISEKELAAEDALWEASMARHADRFASLKAQAKADVKKGNVASMFDAGGELRVA